MKKRMLSALLALCMVLTMAPTVAFAAEGEENPAVPSGSSGGDVVYTIDPDTNVKTAYDSLDKAVDAVADNGTIELWGVVTTSGLNLRKNITIQGADGLKPTITFTEYGIALWGKALTFKDCNIEMKGIGSTPYTGEWNWMTICANSDASLTLNNVEMTMDAEGVSNSPHAIYFCNNNVLNIQNGSKLTIKNYPQDALEWDGGNGGYNVNITDSTFVSDHNRSGFTGTFYATITNSNVDVINSTGNGSNGSHFIIKDSDVNFNDNGSHGLSAGELRIDNSTVTASNNTGMGITVNNGFAVSNNSIVTVTGNASNPSYGYAAVRLYNDYEFSVDETSTLTIKDNHNTGLYVRQGDLTVEDGAKLEITGNKVSHNLLDGYGGGVYVGYGNNYDPSVTLPADAIIYNNHALVAGDDIYVSEGVNGPSLTFGEVGTGWQLDGAPDCTDAIDGWYDDSEGARWEAHTAPYHANKYTEFEQLTGMYGANGLTALKAAHGLETVDPGDETTEWDHSKSKTATNLDKSFDSEVTLSLPSAQEQLVSDVVFVLDKSTSTEVEDEMLAMLEQLKQQVSKTSAKVNVGVVIFNSVANIANDGKFYDLETEYDAIKQAVQQKIESGTNMHAGLLAGKEMLDNDASVEDSRKYLILVSDGLSYYYCKDNNYSEAYTISSRNGGDTGTGGKNEQPNDGLSAWECKYSADYVPTNWNTYFTQVESVLNAEYSKYEYALTDPDRPETTDLDSDGSIPYANRNNYPINVDISLYYSNQLYQEMSQKYHCYALRADTGVNSYGFGVAFMDYLSGGETIDFTDIQNDIYYLLDKGSRVVDVIGAGTDNRGSDYDFEFVNDIESLTLTVNEVPLAKTELPDPQYTDPYVTSSYGFGEADNNVYPFVLNYYEKGEDGKSDECFVWEINVPVSNFAPVQLTYKVHLTNPAEDDMAHGEYDADGYDENNEPLTGDRSLYTNKEATLYPVDSNGESGAAENFAKPTVSYGAITITPVDVTLYIGGTSSYWEDIDGTQTPSANSGIPAPHFYISGADDEEIANMTFHGTGKNEAGEIVNKVWKVEPYGDEGAQAVGENGQKVWNIVSADENAADASCLYFSDIECTDSVDADNIANNQYTHLYATISTTNESGAGNTNLYAMVGGQRYELDYGVGDLTIRSVTNDATSGQEYIFGVAHSTESDIYAVQNDTVAAADATQNGTEAGVVAPAGTNYTVNGKTNWTLVGENTSLLFDDVLSTYELGESGGHDASEAGETMLEQAVIDNAEELGLTDMSGRQYESKYFDLVDAADGNVWVKADNQIVVYWPYPEGITSSNADEYDFDLFHFTGMHREYERGQDEAQELVDQAAANINNHGDYDISNDTVALMVEDIELTDHGIQFIVDQDAFGFSPFVLTWVAKDDSDGGNHSSGGGDNKPDDLNTEDHFAYIIGYPKDYRTGEPTDDESLWPVEPQGNITRAEVATIFFRMLTDDARSENWSQTNSFTDVASTEWYNNAISTLANMGIISGDPDGSFRPDDSITRAEFTKIAVGFFDKAGDYVDGTYEDVSASDWYADFIDAAVDLGLIEGYPDGTIRPNASITRAEACTIVNRTLGRVPDKDHLLAEDEMRVWPDNSDTDAWYYAQIQEATNSHDYNWITEDGEEIEEWTDKLADRDWAQLEREWSDANSAPGGEVVD